MGITVIDREIQRLKATGDPIAGLLEELNETIRAARKPVGADDLDRVVRAAAQGADARVGELVRARLRGLWLTIGIGLGVMLGIGFGIGWVGHGMVRVMGWERTGPEVCQDQSSGVRVCWIPVVERR